VSTQDGESLTATGALLRDLLTADPRYRRLWRTHVRRAHSDLSQAAVAEVIALHLWDSGERSESATSLARELKDRVSRALSGTALSSQTLAWFIAAFDMDEGDESRLWATFSGKENPGLGISHTLRRRREMIRRQCHRTVSLVERYRVGANGSLAVRRTLHTIRAVEDGVDIYIFNHEPQASNIQVLHGGDIGRRHEYGGGLFSVEIILDKPLAKSEATALEYRTYFAPGFVCPAEVRRAAFARAENIDLAVDFDGPRRPQRAWWCVWDDHFGGNPVQESAVSFRNGAIRRYVPFIEETVVGFRWEW
jgi:hypothetical protein